jgi:cytochrome b pre-mRNA-processing protein 3
MLSYFRNRRLLRAQASELYGRVVAQSRTAELYGALGIPDTPEGRLEAIVVHLVLVLRRLRQEGAPGAQLARSLAEAFVTDVDDCLREMGLSDVGIPRRVKKAAAALWDRFNAYAPGLDTKNRETLAAPLAAHATAAPQPAALALADYMLAAARALADQASVGLLAGRVEFPALTSHLGWQTS